MKKTLPIIVSFLLCVMAVAKENPALLCKANTFNNQKSLRFEENKGQVYELGTETPAPYVKYSVQSKGSKVFLLNNGLAYQFERMHYPKDYVQDDRRLSPEQRAKNEALRKDIRLETYRMDLELLGANPQAKISSTGQSEDYVNYYNRNTLEVRSYETITYHNIYPNIDWVIYTHEGGLKYDFVVHPGGNPAHIKLKIKDAENIELQADGSLRLSNRMGEVTEKAPISFQEGETIGTNFQLLESNIFTFKLNSYDPNQTCII